MILNKLKNAVPGKLRVISELAFFPARQSFTSTNPKAAIAGDDQRCDEGVRETLTYWGFPRDEPDTIEPQDPELRTQQ